MTIRPLAFLALAFVARGTEPTAQNWAIGCRAVVHRGDAYWESFGRPVAPQSLFLAQLRERLGR